jgi:hypothetical protein
MDPTERLRDALRERAEAQTPPPFPRSRVAEVRLKQLSYLGMVVVVALAVVFGGSWSVSRVFGENGVPAAQQPPRPTRLYVLDFAPGGDGLRGRAIAVDATDRGGEVTQSFDLGADPDMTLSPDGSRLYAVSHKDNANVLDVFDTTTGALVQQTGVSRYQGTTGAHIAQKIVTSPDGSRVYVLVGFPEDGGANTQSIATFDVVSGALLPDAARLGGCGAAPTLLPTDSTRITVVCGEAHEVRFLTISSTGAVADEDVLQLPPNEHGVSDSSGNTFELGTVRGSDLAPDRRTLYSVTGDGRVFEIDTAEHSLAGTHDLGLSPGESVSMPQVKTSPDGRKIYIGVGSPFSGTDAPPVTADHVLFVDTRTWRRLASIQAGELWSFTVGSRGNRIFGIDHGNGNLVAIDASEGRSIGSLGAFGSRPMAVYAGN